ncbi:hypothetical protein [uncultured Cohaesibacter sp.]|uniref:hypothetical protein n=1 Tax=uncultured Cohaesibacter sp. TaxID=1002546 RepID=UPI0029C83AF3|nr:hypothetical protein [uncultured Cohaesibacter sp.]
MANETALHPTPKEGKELSEAFFHGDLDRCMRLLMQRAAEQGYRFSSETKACTLAQLSASHTAVSSSS